MNAPKVKVGAETLRQVLEREGIPLPSSFKDEEYWLLDPDWLQAGAIDCIGRRTTRANALYTRVHRDVGTYEANVSDCDDYSDTVALEARRLHRFDKDHPREVALAWGTIEFRWDPEDEHQACLAFVWIGEEPTVDNIGVVFFEADPKRFGPTHLSSAERASCSAPVV